MYEATLIYPHQLFRESPALSPSRKVFLIEEPLLLTHNPVHRQKLIFHGLSLSAYEKYLRESGYVVTRLTHGEGVTTEGMFNLLKAEGVSTIHVVDTTDCYLERAIVTSGLTRVWYESPLFMLGKADAIKRYHESKKFMATFYKHMRRDTGILMDAMGEPLGGKFSFDTENRKRLPSDAEIPQDITFIPPHEYADAVLWAHSLPVLQYGEVGAWLPYTHTGAYEFLQQFVKERLAHFGAYEDAMAEINSRLFHSAISPLLNIGLLTPHEVIDAVLRAYDGGDVPISSAEGFIRQIMGWREFVRAAYEVDGIMMRTKNFWGHVKTLPKEFWTGETGILPLDTVIRRALQYGYTHHIERLMVMGNFMLLRETHPDQVYAWFMGMYVDAYDWVMVPNVYGMSQFADGGIFATKPYISGGNYIRKMSDFGGGVWEEVWTALYWYFIHTHKDFFAAQHRLSMMPKILEKMDPLKRASLEARAKAYLSRNQLPSE